MEYDTILSKPTMGRAVLIGILCGWATLTRPTELLSVMIPLLWGADESRWHFLKKHWKLLVFSIAGFAVVSSIQLVYWKWATGHWLVYSYQDQKFDWLKPHFKEVLIGFQSGWLIYSPIMFFGLIGLFLLRRTKAVKVMPILLFLGLFTYVTCAWSVWGYGGSFGARAMVQSYAVWLFPLAAFSQWVSEQRMRSLLFPVVFGWCIWHNLWWTHQAHCGGMFVSEQMSRGYFLKIYGKGHQERDWLKLLDNADEYRAPAVAEPVVIWRQDFEQDTTLQESPETALQGRKSLLLNAEKQFSPLYEIPVVATREQSWLRVGMQVKCISKEWESWKMTQATVRFTDGEKVVRERTIRLQRILDEGETRHLFMEIKVPNAKFNKTVLYLWHTDGDKPVLVDELTVSQF